MEYYSACRLANRKRRKYKNKNRSGFLYPLFKFFKFIQRKLGVKGSPDSFRPYLGPNATEEEIEDLKYQNTRANLKQYMRKEQRKIKALEKRRRPNRFLTKKDIKEKEDPKVPQTLNEFNKTEQKGSFSADNESHAHQNSKNISLVLKELLTVKNYLPYLINSISLFLLSYLLVYLFHQSVIWLVAARWGFQPEIFYYDIFLDDFSHLWNRKNTLIVSSSGPVVSLLLAVMVLGVQFIKPRKNKTLNLFLLWIALQGFNFFFGALAAGIMVEDGFGFVPQWMFLSGFWQIMLAIGSLIFLISIGYSMASKFLDSSHSLRRIGRRKRTVFLLHQAFLPWFIGILVLFLVKSPNNLPYQTGILITMGFVIVPVLLNRNAGPGVNYKPEKNKHRLNFLILTITGILLVLFRTMV